MAVLKVILWVLLKLLGRGPDSSTIYEEETTTTQAEFGTNEDLFVPQNKALANALMEVVAITAIIGVFIWIIYAIVKYAKILADHLMMMLMRWNILIRLQKKNSME